jgi:hypothetical protein
VLESRGSQYAVVMLLWVSRSCACMHAWMHECSQSLFSVRVSLIGAYAMQIGWFSTSVPYRVPYLLSTVSRSKKNAIRDRPSGICLLGARRQTVERKLAEFLIFENSTYSFVLHHC